MGSFGFFIIHRPGSRNPKADALYYRSDMAFQRKANLKQLVQYLFHPKHIVFSATFEAVPNSDVCSKIHELCELESKYQIWLSCYTIDPESNLLLFDNFICIPSNDELNFVSFALQHDSSLSGQFGQAKICELLSHTYYWPGMSKFVNRYTVNCSVCTHVKSFSMDFIVGLPQSGECNTICVVVDRLTKMAHFIPCKDNITSKDLAFMFIKHIFRLRGLPKDIVSDRGSLFTSNFWKSLLSLLKIKPNMLTASHPQTDGQTERTNSILEQYLRVYFNY
ncbi:hypothetical protein G6F43_009608 [Rhizopus delemar]|nr:hypothetical protein G6F43_009608 [Rhizopus delemar]